MLKALGSTAWGLGLSFSGSGRPRLIGIQTPLLWRESRSARWASGSRRSPSTTTRVTASIGLRDVPHWPRPLSQTLSEIRSLARELLDHRVATARDFQAGFDAEVGAGDVALAPKEGERVGLSIDEAEGVEHDAPSHLVVGSTEVEGELVVDEHPNVVVTDEGEDFPGMVLELQVQLEGHVIVVRVALVLQQHPVDRKEPGATRRIAAHDAAVVIVGVRIAGICRVGQELERQVLPHVHVRGVVKPSGEVLGTGRSHRALLGARVLGSLVRAKHCLHDSGVRTKTLA